MKRRAAISGILLAAVLMLSACQGKQKEETRLIGIEQMKNKDYAGAIESFEKVLDLSGGKVGGFEVDVLKYRAEAEYQLEDYSAAVHTYSVLLQVDEACPDYYLYRCMANAKSGNLPEALEDYQNAAKQILEAGAPEAKAQLMELLDSLGVLLGEQEEYREVLLELYQQVLDSGNASGTLYNRMGLLYMEHEEYDKALQLFEQGINLADGQAGSDLLFNQAVVYERKAEYQKALQLFERYAAEFGSDEAVEKEITFLRSR